MRQPSNGRRLASALAAPVLTSVIGAFASLCATVAHAQDKLGVNRPALVAGDVISAEQSGAVFIASKALACSGTLLTNTWAITAQHCQLDVVHPANISVTMGSETRTGAFAVGHPSLDFALVQLASPFTMNGSTVGFRMPLYSGATSTLQGMTLRCRGYGGKPQLRQASMVVKQAPVDDYSFSLVQPNGNGQMFEGGDSGGGCSANTAQGWALAGILKGPDMGRPENWRDWASAYVNGTPIPLPDHWFVYTSTHPTFLTRPLPNGYTDSYTWYPSPDGANYSFTPTFDLETGGDFISISSAGHSVTLTGTGSTICRGAGALTVKISTNPSRPSVGLLSMPIVRHYTGPSSDAPGTNFPPDLAGVGNNVYFFVTSQDGRVMYNRALVGQAGLCWANVEGSGQATAAPSAAAVDNHVFVAMRGTDGSLQLNQADLGKPFSAWSPLNLRTRVAPGLSSVGKSIFVFATGLDGRIMLNQAELGHGFSGWFEVQGNGHSNDAPSAAAVGNHVFVAIRAQDNMLYLNQADFGSAFGNWFPLNLRSDAAPALAAVGGSIFIFAKAMDGRILLNQAALGHAFSGWVEVQGGGRTNTAPSAASVGNHVFVSIRGVDGALYTNQADFGKPFGAWFK